MNELDSQAGWCGVEAYGWRCLNLMEDGVRASQGAEVPVCSRVFELVAAEGGFCHHAGAEEGEQAHGPAEAARGWHGEVVMLFCGGEDEVERGLETSEGQAAFPVRRCMRRPAR